MQSVLFITSILNAMKLQLLKLQLLKLQLLKVDKWIQNYIDIFGCIVIYITGVRFDQKPIVIGINFMMSHPIRKPRDNRDFDVLLNEPNFGRVYSSRI